MRTNIAVTAFTEQHKQINIKSNDVRILHARAGVKICHVPNALKEPLRQLKSLGQEFAYVVLETTGMRPQQERALIPIRDLQILKRTHG
jgi:G3E family GTPase